MNRSVHFLNCLALSAGALAVSPPPLSRPVEAGPGSEDYPKSRSGRSFGGGGAGFYWSGGYGYAHNRNVDSPEVAREKAENAKRSAKGSRARFRRR